MSQTKIKVPEGMLLAASEFDPGAGEYNIEPILEAALRWMSENPIVPTDADALTLLQERVASGHLSNKEYCAIPATTIRCVIREWQRRMFLAPEPEVPEIPPFSENVSDFITRSGFVDGRQHNQEIQETWNEAYRLGQKSPS